MIAKYGILNFIIILLSAVSLVLFGIYLGSYFFWILGIPGVFLSLVAIIVFRDIPHTINPNLKNNPALITSPCDGRIIDIKEEYESNFIEEDAIKISIAISFFNNHINRNPVYGEVEYMTKSSENNDRVEESVIGVRSLFAQKVTYKQITGTLARRIVCKVSKGDTVIAGEKFGMIIFGRRMDIFVPINAEIKVQTGSKVRAGQTELAMLKEIE